MNGIEDVVSCINLGVNEVIEDVPEAVAVEGNDVVAELMNGNDDGGPMVENNEDVVVVAPARRGCCSRFRKVWAIYFESGGHIF